tara:strand:- start:891 stop:1160 length:270 start_codon:yes stop_codon:yes gene_type:complete
MKKLLTVLSFGLLLTGCEKEERDYQSNCNCGTITKVRYVKGYEHYYNEYYILDVQNNCTGNIEDIKITVPEFTEWKHGVGQGECLEYKW